MPSISIYLPEEHYEFLQKYIVSESKNKAINTSLFFREKIEEDMLDCEKFCLDKIESLKKEIKKQEKLLKNARKNKEKRIEAYNELIGTILQRKQSDTFSVNGFLDGATGKRLMVDAKITKAEVMKIVRTLK